MGLPATPALTAAADEVMARVDVRASRPEASISLSGGNQQKVVLARELSVEPLVFLLAAHRHGGWTSVRSNRLRRIRAARDRGAGVLMISSELDELIAVSDRVVVIYRGRIVGEMPARRGTARPSAA